MTMSKGQFDEVFKSFRLKPDGWQDYWSSRKMTDKISERRKDVEFGTRFCNNLKGGLGSSVKHSIREEAISKAYETATPLNEILLEACEATVNYWIKEQMEHINYKESQND